MRIEIVCNCAFLKAWRGRRKPRRSESKEGRGDLEVIWGRRKRGQPGVAGGG